MSAVTDDMRRAGPLGQAVVLSFRLLLAAVSVIALGWSLSNIREIPPDGQAVVTRFGAVVRVQGAGLLVAWPRPVEEITVIPSGARQIQLAVEPFRSPVSGGADTDGPRMDADPRLNGGFVMTGDSSVVHLDVQLFYRVSDPAAYFVARDRVDTQVQRLFVASAVSLAAGRSLDAILVARPEAAARAEQAAQRERLRSELTDAVNRRLSALADAGAGPGIEVTRVDLVPAIPYGAKAAFDAVIVATQDAAHDVAVASTSAQYTKKRADESRDRIMIDAGAAARERVAAATGATASILALGQGTPWLSQDARLSQIFYARVGAILAKAGRVRVVGRDGTGHLLIPGASR